MQAHAGLYTGMILNRAFKAELVRKRGDVLRVAVHVLNADYAVFCEHVKAGRTKHLKRGSFTDVVEIAASAELTPQEIALYVVGMAHIAELCVDLQDGAAQMRTALQCLPGWLVCPFLLRA